MISNTIKSFLSQYYVKERASTNLFNVQEHQSRVARIANVGVQADPQVCNNITFLTSVNEG